MFTDTLYINPGCTSAGIFPSVFGNVLILKRPHFKAEWNLVAFTVHAEYAKIQ